jgi:hypothetical protein
VWYLTFICHLSGRPLLKDTSAGNVNVRAISDPRMTIARGVVKFEVRHWTVVSIVWFGEGLYVWLSCGETYFNEDGRICATKMLGFISKIFVFHLPGLSARFNCWTWVWCRATFIEDLVSRFEGVVLWSQKVKWRLKTWGGVEIRIDSLALEGCYSMKARRVYTKNNPCKGGSRSIKIIIKNNYCYISSTFEVSSIMLICIIRLKDPRWRCQGQEHECIYLLICGLLNPKFAKIFADLHACLVCWSIADVMLFSHVYVETMFCAKQELR